MIHVKLAVPCAARVRELSRALTFTVALLVPALSSAQVRTEVVRGRVTAADGSPIVGAEVTATRAPDRAFFRATTDTAGAYVIRIDSGSGDYLVHARAVSQPTWPALRRRVARTQQSDSVLIADFTLRPPAAQTLSAVRIEASRPLPQRKEASLGAVDVGAREMPVEGMAVQVGPELRGNIAALALTLAGVTRAEGGYSVLGAPPSENTVTLNGASLNAAQVPRDAPIVMSVLTSSADPARGWFSGAEANVNISPGMAFTTRSASISLDDPAGQAASRRNTGADGDFRRVDVGLGGSGLMLRDRLAYSYGVQANRRLEIVPTLESASRDQLGLLGVAPDSVARLGTLLSARRLPWPMGRKEVIPTQSASLIVRLNSNQFDPGTFAAAKKSGGIILFGAHDDSRAVGDGGRSTSSTGTSSHSDIVSIIGVLSNFVRPRVLHDLRVSLTSQQGGDDPATMGVRGRVLVNSMMPDSTAGLTVLQFGAGGAALSHRSGTAELQSETVFYPRRNSRHRLKLNGDVRVDRLERTRGAETGGTYAFGSLDDLAADLPLSYTRIVNATSSRAVTWNAFLSAGDVFRVTPALQLQMGLRVERNGVLGAPASNEAVWRSFGVRNDYVPRRLHVSPRVGFTWLYQRRGYPGGYRVNNGWGVFAPPATGVIRGSLGEYRSMIGPKLMLDAAAETGLPEATQRLVCLGDAVPPTEWGAALANASPSAQRCAVSGNSELAQTSPTVRLVDRSFDAPRSWRAHLSWTSSVGKTTMAVEGALAWNINQVSPQDLNFDARPRFTLANEGRPVFVPAASIVATSGAIPLMASRRSVEFAQVTAIGSGLKGLAQQLTVSARTLRGKWAASLAYTWQDLRAQLSGYTASTAADPGQAYWARSDLDIRHGVVFQAGRGFKYINVSLAGRLSSGRPFTPLAAGDLNGDGLSNDRAYVFDDATSPDTIVAAGMRTLLSAAPRNASSCLRRQRGRIAGANSCDGPWEAEMSARIGLNTFRMGERWMNWIVELFISNPLGGLDQLAHGSRLKGWGTQSFPDPILLRVVGFDLERQRYQYAVNPRFGDSRASSFGVRNPFRVTLSVKLDLAPSLSVQQVDRFLRQGRGGRPGKKLTAEELKRRYALNVPDPYRILLQYSDSLLLQSEQVSAIETAQRSYQVQVDSAWLEFTRYLEGLPDTFKVAEVVTRQERVIDGVWNLGRPDVQRTLPRILTEVQLQMLPSIVNTYYTAKEPIKGMRTFMYGYP